MAGSAIGGGAVPVGMLGNTLAQGAIGGPLVPMPQPPALGGGKGGGQPSMPRPTQGQFAPLAPQGQFNVNQAAAGGLQQAMMGTQAGMGFQPSAVQATGYRPATGMAQGYNAAQAGARGYGAQNVQGVGPITAQQVTAGQIAGTDLGVYTNPYENQVVSAALRDISGAQQQAMNQIGAQATAARAFGGSRQGIAEAETNRAFIEQAAKTAAGLRQAGFQQAQQLAGQDIATRMQAGLANQQAGLQAGTTTAQLGQQAQLANQAAQNAAGQFGASASNVAALQNAAAINAARGFGAGAQNAMTGQNLAAINAASQFGAQNQMTAQQINAANALAANQQRLGAASQLGGLANQAFQTGQTIQQQQSQQGLLQQGLQQALIDAARGQYAGYIGSPQAALGAPLAALGATPVPQSTTKSQEPGLFQYLQLAAGLPGVSDARLKKNVTAKGKIGNVNFYTWDWNDAGKKIADPAQPTFGVIADELQKTHPHLVSRGNDGYLRVNYAGLASELENAA
jgi:hypothetical protein